MLNEAVQGLKINPKGVYVDVTYGAGGHSKAIFEKLDTGRLFAFDQDEDARVNALDSDRFVFVPVNYRYLYNYMDYYGQAGVNGVLADLGVSSHQLDEGGRGFSFRFDHDLDMRMDRRSELSAIDVLNTYVEEDLVKVFSAYGEVRNSKSLAREFIRLRRLRKLKASSDVNRVLERYVVGERNRYFSQVYQAIRIEVNDELRGLEDMLDGAMKILREGGRLVVISYHSLEDRIVKKYFKYGNFRGELIKDEFGVVQKSFRVVSKKPVVPTHEELERNPRSRSAKLRIVEKIINNNDR